MKRVLIPHSFYFTVITLVVLGSFGWLVSPLQARVGDSQSTIERRLFAAGGIIYRDEVIKESRMKGMPYLRFLDYMPENAELRVYFKTDDGRKPTSSQMEAKRVSTGWDIHVLYVRGVSVLEVYRRSKRMTDYELNILLQLQAGGSYWEKVEAQKNAVVADQAEGSAMADAVEAEEPVSAFGFEMVRNDGKVRARKSGGNMLLVFNAGFDTRLAVSLEADLQEQAPRSVSGF